jgi:hypothetical protein
MTCTTYSTLLSYIWYATKENKWDLKKKKKKKVREKKLAVSTRASRGYVFYCTILINSSGTVMCDASDENMVSSGG